MIVHSQCWYESEFSISTWEIIFRKFLKKICRAKQEPHIFSIPGQVFLLISQRTLISFSSIIFLGYYQSYLIINFVIVHPLKTSATLQPQINKQLAPLTGFFTTYLKPPLRICIRLWILFNIKPGKRNKELTKRKTNELRKTAIFSLNLKTLY